MYNTLTMRDDALTQDARQLFIVNFQKNWKEYNLLPWATHKNVA